MRISAVGLVKTIWWRERGSIVCSVVVESNEIERTLDQLGLLFGNLRQAISDQSSHACWVVTFDKRVHKPGRTLVRLLTLARYIYLLNFDYEIAWATDEPTIQTWILWRVSLQHHSLWSGCREETSARLELCQSFPLARAAWIREAFLIKVMLSGHLGLND